MKKIVIVLLLLCMLFVLVSCSETTSTTKANNSQTQRKENESEEFIVHSGVKFGMTKDDIYALEKDAGFSPEEADKGDRILVKGYIAGYDDTSLYYSFTDDKMETALYCFFPDDDHAESTYQNLNSVLTGKYGDPFTSNNGKIEYIDFGVESYDALHGLKTAQKSLTCNIQNSKQWIIPVHGGYTDIKLIHFYSIIGNKRSDAIYISYSFVTTEKYNTVMSEKSKQIQEKQDSQYNDL